MTRWVGRNESYLLINTARFLSIDGVRSLEDEVSISGVVATPFITELRVVLRVLDCPFEPKLYVTLAAIKPDPFNVFLNKCFIHSSFPEW